jgi:hypothetical protein
VQRESLLSMSALQPRHRVRGIGARGRGKAPGREPGAFGR